MQRFFKFCVLALCLTLAGCTGDGGMPTIPPKDLTMIAATVVPPPTAIPISPEMAIVLLTNDALERFTDPLAKTLDADYLVLDVHFAASADGQLVLFLIKARCQCANNTNCCMLERTFVVVVNAMKAVHGKISGYIPANVDKVQVSCLDRSRPLGMVEASWNDLESFFTEAISGGQFGSRVQIFSTP